MSDRRGLVGKELKKAPPGAQKPQAGKPSMGQGPQAAMVSKQGAPAAGAKGGLNTKQTGAKSSLSYEDVAEKLNVAPAKVEEWVRRGLLKAAAQAIQPYELEKFKTTQLGEIKRAQAEFAAPAATPPKVGAKPTPKKEPDKQAPEKKVSEKPKKVEALSPKSEDPERMNKALEFIRQALSRIQESVSTSLAALSGGGKKRGEAESGPPKLKVVDGGKSKRDDMDQLADVKNVEQQVDNFMQARGLKADEESTTKSGRQRKKGDSGALPPSVREELLRPQEEPPTEPTRWDEVNRQAAEPAPPAPQWMNPQTLPVEQALQQTWSSTMPVEQALSQDWGSTPGQAWGQPAANLGQGQGWEEAPPQAPAPAWGQAPAQAWGQTDPGLAWQQSPPAPLTWAQEQAAQRAAHQAWAQEQAAQAPPAPVHDPAAQQAWAQEQAAQQAWAQEQATQQAWAQEQAAQQAWAQEQATQQAWAQEQAAQQAWAQEQATQQAWAQEQATQQAWAQEQAAQQAWAQEQATQQAWAQEQATQQAWAQEQATQQAWAQEQATPQAWAQEQATPQAWAQEQAAPPAWALDQAAQQTWGGQEPAQGWGQEPAQQAWGREPAQQAWGQTESARPQAEATPTAGLEAQAAWGQGPAEPAAEPWGDAQTWSSSSGLAAPVSPPALAPLSPSGLAAPWEQGAAAPPAPAQPASDDWLTGADAVPSAPPAAAPISFGGLLAAPLEPQRGPGPRPPEAAIEPAPLSQPIVVEPTDEERRNSQRLELKSRLKPGERALRREPLFNRPLLAKEEENINPPEPVVEPPRRTSDLLPRSPFALTGPASAPPVHSTPPGSLPPVPQARGDESRAEEQNAALQDLRAELLKAHTAHRDIQSELHRVKEKLGEVVEARDQAHDQIGRSQAQLQALNQHKEVLEAQLSRANQQAGQDQARGLIQRDERIRQLEGELSQALSVAEERARNQARLELDRENLRREGQALAQSYAEAQQRAASLESQIQRNNVDLSYAAGEMSRLAASGGQLGQAQERVRALEAELQEARSDVGNARNRISSLQSEMVAKDSRFIKLEQEHDDLIGRARGSQEAERQLSETRGLLAQRDQRLQELQRESGSRVQHLESELQQAGGWVGKLTEAVSARDKRIAELEANLAASASRGPDPAVSAELMSARVELSSLKRNAEVARLNALKLETDLSDARAAAQRGQAAIGGLERQVREAQQLREQLENRLSEGRVYLEEVRAENSSLRSQLNEAVRRLELAQKAFASSGEQGDVKAMQQHIKQLESEVVAAMVRLSASEREKLDLEQRLRSAGL